MENLPRRSFPLFAALPLEIRLAIWELALPGPRVIQLELQLLAKDPRYPLRMEDSAPFYLTTGKGECLDDCQGGYTYRAPGIGSCSDCSLRRYFAQLPPPDKDTRHEKLISVQGRLHANLRSVVGKARFKSKTPIPALLVTCREAYTVASKHYQPAFGTVFRNGSKQTWFDFEHDTLHLGETTAPVLVGRRGIGVLMEWFFIPEEMRKVKHVSIDVKDWVRGSGEYAAQEVWLASRLDFFGNLETFTVVWRDYVIGYQALPSAKAEGEPQLELLDPIDMPRAIKAFTDPNTYTSQKELQEKEVLVPTAYPASPANPADTFDVGALEKLRAAQKADPRSRERGEWQIPTFHKKVLVSTALKEEVFKMQRDFEARTGYVCYTGDKKRKYGADIWDCLLHST